MELQQNKHANVLLRRQRQQRGWSLKRVAEELCRLCENEERLPGVNENIIGKWERGEKRPGPYYRELFCKLYGLSAEELGFIDTVDSEEHLKNDPPTHVIVGLSLFDMGIQDKLDNAESIINLAWEAWFASRPREAARSVSKLLPGLEKITSSPYLLDYTLQAKKLTVRAHGLLGSICLDASQNDTALFHYMQAYRFAEELRDTDLAATYLCLTGDVLRRQKEQFEALRYMENARELAIHASNTTRGHILQLLAYAYGDTGQEAAFERTIAEATDLLAFSGEGIDIAQKEFIPFEVYEIRGKINRELGRPLNALPYLELAEKWLNTTDSVTPRWHALLEISRSQTYCDAGDITTGIELACKGFMIAYQCHSLHQMNRVRKLLRKLEGVASQNHPRVQNLKNLLYETYVNIE